MTALIEETLVFVDGENISLRYKQLLKDGRKPREDNVCFGESFVWNAKFFRGNNWNIRRVSYYASMVGDDDAIRDLRRNMAKITYSCDAGSMTRTNQIVPFVRKKSSRSVKEGICDIAITVDVMRACYRDHASGIWIVSGDGDFVQLITEAVHAGKHVYASAFSSGLNDEIPMVVDEFFSLDDVFFEPEAKAEPPS